MYGRTQWNGVVVGWPDETVAEMVVNYPQRKVRRRTWTPEVAEFTTATISKIELKARDTVRDQLMLTGHLAQWWQDKGRPLDVEQVFDPYTVTQFVDDGMPGGEGTRVTYESILRRLGPLVTKKAPWPRRVKKPTKPRVMAPYSSVELDMLEADACTQRTELARHRFMAFLDLCLGAGVDDTVVNRVYPDDLVTEGRTLLVRVHKPYERLVPVRRSRANRLLRLAEQTPAGEYLVRGHRDTPPSALMTNFRLSPSSPQPVVMRLRANWVVHHLTIGTPLQALLEAAGIGKSGVRTVINLLRYAPRVDADKARRMLERG